MSDNTCSDDTRTMIREDWEAYLRQKAQDKEETDMHDKPCGCRIEYCPLHKATADLLRACEDAVKIIDTCPAVQYAFGCDCVRCETAWTLVRAIKAARGEQ